MEEKKQRTHKVLDKHPVFGSILATGIFIVIFYITMSAADLALIQFMSEGMASGPAILVGFMISTLLFWWWFRDETKGLWIGGDIKAGGFAILLMVIYWIVSVIQGIIVSGDRYGLPKPEDVSLAVSAGFMEDTVMRGFIIMLLLRKKRTPKMIMVSMIVTSLIFALLHATNLTSGASVEATATQVLKSFATGFSFCLIYVCSGNILPAALVHTLHDIIAFSTIGATEGGVMVGAVNAGSWIDMALCYIFAIIGFLYLKREDIMKRTIGIWDKKWQL